ncbi:MAG: GWxTD domain-containing protein [Vicingaceae bacterium]
MVLDYSYFNIPNEKAFAEFYMKVDGTSLTYQFNPKDSSYQANLEVTYLIEADSTIIAYEKFQLNSPKYRKGDIKADLLDIKRLSIPNGSYKLTLLTKDLNNGFKTESTHDLRNIKFNDNPLELSEIQIADSIQTADKQDAFTKNGLDISPNLNHFFGALHNSLSFYFEIYSYSKEKLSDSLYLIEYSIVKKGENTVVANSKSFKRISVKPVIPIAQTFDIQNLPSGAYEILVSLKNRENEVIDERRNAFQRSNPDLVNYSSVNAEGTFVDSITDKTLLANYIRSLYPISSDAEKQFAENQLKYSDLKFMQQYFLNFWMSRNPEEPEMAWLNYKDEVIKADELFGYGNIEGYQTERGRVYLQYGPPDAKQNVPYEYNTYPYSVWLYNQLEGQTNRKFLFYSPSMGMSGYKILHSNVRGEIYNPNWEYELTSKTNSGAERTREVREGEMVNRRARDLWENPR